MSEVWDGGQHASQAPCNADGNSGRLTACTTADEWGSSSDLCTIPGQIAARAPANRAINGVCEGLVSLVPLTDSVLFRRYGTLYVFKDYSDNLFVTAVVDGTLYSASRETPLIEVSGGSPSAARMFAWPVAAADGDGSAFSNYEDQVPRGRYSCLTTRVLTTRTCDPYTSTHSISPLLQATNGGCLCRGSGVCPMALGVRPG
ncbi:hypothetical protein FOA52_010106 [Chlamydomonas sp. UWO 241]|nr:hypothetical protein FOA52_010106 [Chlamydomonas sp. UWO 241]